MKNVLLTISFLLVVSCTPKPNTIKLSNYQYGLEAAESIDLIDNLTPIGNFCLENNIESNEEQLLIPKKYYKYIHYKYELDEVISWLNNLNECGVDSPVIFFDKVVSNNKNYHKKRINEYSSYISLSTNYLCSLSSGKFISQASQKLTKHGLMLSEKKNQAIMSATVILAFHAAVSDIYDQIKRRCN